MTDSYKDLLKQREDLEKKISEARRQELSAAVAQVRGLVAEYGLTAQDAARIGLSLYDGSTLVVSPSASQLTLLSMPELPTGQTQKMLVFDVPFNVAFDRIRVTLTSTNTGDIQGLRVYGAVIEQGVN